ncbi:MAG: hypothetical protein FJY98_01165 [Candidatus Liptonbacteria bacterium]|nr:hypothetical protein [Candidatus Liptonbacteria bacterium]
MHTFSYTGTNSAGAPVSGTINAANHADAMVQIAALGITVAGPAAVVAVMPNTPSAPPSNSTPVMPPWGWVLIAILGTIVVVAAIMKLATPSPASAAPTYMAPPAAIPPPPGSTSAPTVIPGPGPGNVSYTVQGTPGATVFVNDNRFSLSINGQTATVSTNTASGTSGGAGTVGGSSTNTVIRVGLRGKKEITIDPQGQSDIVEVDDRSSRIVLTTDSDEVAVFFPNGRSEKLPARAERDVIGNAFTFHNLGTNTITVTVQSVMYPN